DMFFCKLLRTNGVFMFATNIDHYGHLAVMDTYDTSRKHPDFYEIYANEVDWVRRYIHENYSQVLANSQIIEQPCPDVFWFPVVTPLFCRHLIGKPIDTPPSAYSLIFARNHGKLWPVVGWKESGMFPKISFQLSH